VSDSWLKSSFRSRNGLLQWLSLGVALAFVVWIILTRREDLVAVLKLTPQLFALISVSSLLTFAVNGIELKVLAGRFGSRIGFGDSLLLGLMVSTLNYLPMKTGTMLNGALLKVRHKVSLAHFAALVAGSSVIHLWVALVLAGVVLVGQGNDPLLAWSFVLVPTAVVIGLIVWGRTRREGKLDEHSSKLLRVAGRAVDGMGLIFSSHRLLAIEIVLNVTLIVLASLRTMWGFQALSSNAGFADALVVTAVGIFAARLSVIPGGIGFREGGSAAGAALAGIPAGLGLAASVIDRAVTLVWLLLLGVPAAVYLQRVTGIDLLQAQQMRGASEDDAPATEGAPATPKTEDE